MINYIKKQLKILLLQEDMFLKDLAKELSNKTGKEYSPNSLSQRIARNTITYSEMVYIAGILGYQIKFEKID